MLKWLRIFVAAALFLSGVWLGYSVRKSPSKPLQSIVAAVTNPASIPGQLSSAVTHIVTAPISYTPGKQTKYRLGVTKTLDDLRLEIDQITLSYRAYQRLWIDFGYSRPQQALLIGVSWEF
jgi:hypothetical protein